MFTIQEMFKEVGEWQKAFECGYFETRPEEISGQVIAMRHHLMTEELAELCTARLSFTSGKVEAIVDVADALADLAWVILGTACEYGIVPLSINSGVNHADLGVLTAGVADMMAPPGYVSAEELTDAMNVIFKLAEDWGIDFDRVWAEVKRANYAKLIGGKPIKNAEGRVLKPGGWRGPDHSWLLETVR